MKQKLKNYNYYAWADFLLAIYQFCFIFESNEVVMSYDIDFSFSKYKDYLILKIKGTVDTYNTAHFKKILQKAYEKEPKNLAIDLGDIDFFDSSAIKVLIMYHKIVIKNGGNFFLIKINDNTYSLLKLAALHTYFNIEESKEKLNTAV